MHSSFCCLFKEKHTIRKLLKITWLNAVSYRFESDGNSEKVPSSNLSKTSVPLLFVEKDRKLPIKLDIRDEMDIIKHALQVIEKQKKDGKTIRLPYNMWKLAMDRCQISYSDYIKLDPASRDIVQAHWSAVKNHHLFYKDPKSKLFVLTVTSLLLNGECCGRSCRHCPYDHVNVSEAMKQKTFWNGAFYDIRD
ncbi:Uncharacterized protein TPS_02596 [Trichinella pseudospiralis]